MRTVTMSQFGRSFATRGRGEELRDEVVHSLDQGEPILVLDFAGVTNLTYSFADEFVGKFIEAHPEVEVRIENAASSFAGTLERARNARSAIC